ncbi:MAG: restriction endonuclease, partial [Pseudomonadota bacterium]
GINQVYTGGAICDLFSGSASLAGAIAQQCTMHSNDIQSYSKILADTYNKAFKQKDTPNAHNIIQQAEQIIKFHKIEIDIKYDKDMSLNDFECIENKQRNLIHQKFDYPWHLFAKNYSGTWWSYEQCLWIDAIREVAEHYTHLACYPAIISSLMFSMAYAGQGTGHYAQSKHKVPLKILSYIENVH